jgi:1,4-dihydroxy-2-naphthoyl-CoA hydrolase
MIWQRSTSLAELNVKIRDTLMAHLGIVYTRLVDDELEAIMPVDHRTRQPFGLLHGGASVVLAESLGSAAGYLCTSGDDHVVGLEVNANHVRGVKQGNVRGICRAIHLGRTHQVWDIRINDEQQRLCCIARLTTAILTPGKTLS